MDRGVEVGKGDEQGGDKDDEIGLSVSEYAGRVQRSSLRWRHDARYPL